MNILVTGANGQLGHEMQICAKNSNHKFVFTDMSATIQYIFFAMLPFLFGNKKKEQV